MALKGYTNPDDVASLLGRTFTASQTAVCDRVIAAAEEWIDDKTKRRYLEPVQKTHFLWGYPGPTVTLRSVPIATVDNIFVRTIPGGVESALIPSTDYQIQDAEQGIIYIPRLKGNVEDIYSVRIVYTPETGELPSKIKLATELLVTHWMRPVLLDEIPGVSQFSLGGEESISYTQLIQTEGVPAEVMALLGISSGGTFYFA